MGGPDVSGPCGYLCSAVLRVDVGIDPYNGPPRPSPGHPSCGSMWESTPTADYPAPPPTAAVVDGFQTRCDGRYPAFGGVLSIQVVLEVSADTGMPQLAEGLGLDLAYAFPGDLELQSHFLKGAWVSVFEPEA